MKLVIHYHEIALKGRNRNLFVQRLVRNLRSTFQDLGRVSVRTLFGRLTVTLPGEDAEEVHRRMAGVFGVANYSLVEEVAQDFSEIAQAAWRQVQESPARSFAVRCRRPDKNFPMGSLDMEREVGAFIWRAARDEGRDLRVDLTRPELTVRLEIVNGTALVSGPRHQGPGGLPVGTGGRVVGLLSSGFDSPVACWNLMKRGAEVVMCHFHAHPFTDRASLENCRQLADILTRFQYRTRLYLVAFAPVQEEILSLTPSELRMVLYRRSMFRIAQAVARRERAQALLTGESLGQVASQTLTNLAVIDQAATMPVLRPLIGADKEEIMARARQIGTYELSAQPYEDCCSLMVARHPATRAALEEVLRIEEALELAEVEGSALEGAEVIDLKWRGQAGMLRKVLREPVTPRLRGEL
jgi:thiamine biosynthesis protein ThiI